MKSSVRRLLPAIGLYFLAPLVAEFLLGDFPITMIGILLVLAPLYGGGALLIRETVRRTHRGWPSILMLALAYGTLEEAFTTQTLFNPNYLGLNLHLLSHAYLPALGIGAWWTIFVLTLHTVWSISVPVELVEALVPERAATPWLGRTGLAVVAILFVLDAVSMTYFAIKHDPKHFVASPAQFGVSATFIVAFIVMAFFLPRWNGERAKTSVPSSWAVGIVALLAGSIFLVVPPGWGWWAVAAYLALDLALGGTVWLWSHRSSWNGRHRLALAAGVALAYAWHAFIQSPVAGGAGMADRAGNAVFAVGVVILIAAAAQRTVTVATAAEQAAVNRATNQ